METWIFVCLSALTVVGKTTQRSALGKSLYLDGSDLHPGCWVCQNPEQPQETQRSVGGGIRASQISPRQWVGLGAPVPKWGLSIWGCVQPWLGMQWEITAPHSSPVGSTSLGSCESPSAGGKRGTRGTQWEWVPCRGALPSRWLFSSPGTAPQTGTPPGHQLCCLKPLQGFCCRSCAKAVSSAALSPGAAGEPGAA